MSDRVYEHEVVVDNLQLTFICQGLKHVQAELLQSYTEKAGNIDTPQNVVLHSAMLHAECSGLYQTLFNKYLGKESD